MRSKKVGYALFLCAVLLLCALPAAVMPWRQEQPVGNERPAAFPSAAAEDGTLNLDFLEEFADYFADHFGFRHELITVNDRATAAAFNTLDSDSVLLGRDGWLFYRETEADYTGTNLFSARQSWCAARTLALIQEYCGKNGIDFLFTIAPNKNSLYGDKMPRRYIAATVRNAGLVAQQLRAQGVEYFDLYALLSSQEGTLYYRCDSHWNMAGAQLSARALLNALGAEVPDFDAKKTGGTQAHTGDLYEMVYPSGTETEADAAYSFDYEYLGNFRSVDDITIRTSNAAAQGSIYVYRDSFGNNLHPFLAQAYGNACFSRVMPYKLSAVLQEQPDVLLIEIVERNLDWLLERAPELPAPEREPDGQPADTGKTVPAAVEECGLEGYVRIAGDLGDIAIDDDSPVYIAAGGTVWEASPSGEGTVPFTACLPADAAGQELLVLVKADGQLVKIAIAK